MKVLFYNKIAKIISFKTIFNTESMHNIMSKFDKE